jgi:hypothetical protein
MLQARDSQIGELADDKADRDDNDARDHSKLMRTKNGSRKYCERRRDQDQRPDPVHKTGRRSYQRTCQYQQQGNRQIQLQ